MGDDEDSAFRHQIRQGLLNQTLRLGIEFRRRLIENQNRRILEERPSYRKPLALAPTQALPSLAQNGLISLGHSCDEVMCKSSPSCRIYALLAHAGLAVTNVVPDRVIEKDRFLCHDSDLSTQRS